MPKRELRALALASETMRLQNLDGYLRSPTPLPVATIALDYVNRTKAAERLVPRKGVAQGDDDAPAPGDGSDGKESADVQREFAFGPRLRLAQQRLRGLLLGVPARVAIRRA